VTSMSSSDQQVDERFALSFRPNVDVGEVSHRDPPDLLFSQCSSRSLLRPGCLQDCPTLGHLSDRIANLQVMCFSPMVQRKFPNSKAAHMTTLEHSLSRTDAAKAAVPSLEEAFKNKKRLAVATISSNSAPSLMQTPQEATKMLNAMANDNLAARSWLREVSQGPLKSDGPYWSPCRVKDQAELDKIKTFHNHKLYQEFVAKDQYEYQNLLAVRDNTMKGDTGKQIDHLKTIAKKFRQATQELLKKREQVVMRAYDDEMQFAKREKAYKEQVCQAVRRNPAPSRPPARLPADVSPQVSLLSHKNSEFKAAMQSTGDAAHEMQERPALPATHPQRRPARCGARSSAEPGRGRCRSALTRPWPRTRPSKPSWRTRPRQRRRWLGCRNALVPWCPARLAAVPGSRTCDAFSGR